MASPGSRMFLGQLAIFAKCNDIRYFPLQDLGSIVPDSTLSILVCNLSYPYEQGEYVFELTLPFTFPLAPPSIKCCTRNESLSRAKRFVFLLVNFIPKIG